MSKACNMCGKELVIKRFKIINEEIEQIDYYCIKPFCPNFALLQISVEDMPKDETKEIDIEPWKF